LIQHVGALFPLLAVEAVDSLPGMQSLDQGLAPDFDEFFCRECFLDAKYR